jgi:hypothetical protein
VAVPLLLSKADPCPAQEDHPQAAFFLNAPRIPEPEALMPISGVAEPARKAGPRAEDFTDVRMPALGESVSVG